jgi:uncharacterized protein
MNEMADKNKSEHIRVPVFAFAFYVLIPSLIFAAARSGLIGGPVRSVLTNSITLYLFPTLIYLVFVDRANLVQFLKLRRNAIQGMVWGFGLGLIFAGYGLAVNQFSRGGIINLDLKTGTWIWAIGLVGILQEIPFRGFLLQKLEGGMRFISANVVTALFFVVFHVPRWYFRGQFPGLSSFLYLFVFSLFMGYALKRSQSLWSCILFHSIHNLVTFTLL